MLRRSVIRAATAICVLVLACVALETFSWAVLKAELVQPNATAALIADSFPAVLRLDRALRIDAARGQTLRARSPLAMDVFAYDPALGFRNLSYLRWYTAERASPPADITTWSAWWDRFATEARGRFVVLCFGGSTTASGQPANWPRHVADLLALHDVAPRAIVLNAGHNGFTTMQQQLWASYWILPELDRRGIAADLVLSLDGVNDISYGLGGWQAYSHYRNDPWLKMYNGFHQFIDAHTKSLERPGPALLTLSRALLATRVGNEAIDLAAAWLPTTLAFARSLTSPPAYPPIVEFLMAYERHNVFRVRGLVVAIPWERGSIDLVEAPSDPSAKVGRSLRETLDLVDGGVAGGRADGVDVGSLAAPDPRQWSALPALSIPKEAIDEVLNAYRSNLIAFQSVFTGRGVHVINALQPIADPDRNPRVRQSHGKDIPHFDYVLAHWAMSGAQPGALVRAPARDVYRAAERVYATLAEAYPGRYVALTDLFDDGAEDYFTFDNIHYTARASVRIASALVGACLRAGRCGKAAKTTIAAEDRDALAAAGRLQDDVTPHLIASRGDYNVVRYGGRYVAVPQRAGAIAWETQDLSTIPGLIAGYAEESVMRALDGRAPSVPADPGVDRRSPRGP
jgi:lysophospholipase L1-like esterase